MSNKQSQSYLLMALAAGTPEIITDHLASKGLLPKAAWVAEFLSTQRANIPQQALQSSAFFRMIHGDITTSVHTTSTNVLPSNIHDASIRERKLKGLIPVQLLDIEDMSQSRWSQAETIEAVERGETTRGREIIRVVANENESDQTQSPATQGPHKLTFQDAKGVQVFAFELSPVPNLNLNKTMIGCKLLLKDVDVARAVILLTPNTIVHIGGKIDDLHQKWVRGRKERLRETARASAQS